MEAAVPRFVTKEGDPVAGRDWSKDDMMVNDDEDDTTFLLGSDFVRDRDLEIPLYGVRNRFDEPAMLPLCRQDPDGNIDDFILEAYSTCALQFSKRQFE